MSSLQFGPSQGQSHGMSEDLMLEATRRLLTSANFLTQGSASHWQMMHISLACLQNAFARPLQQTARLDEVSQVAFSCIQTAVMCCPEAVAAACRASPPADAAATLAFIAHAMASILCIFHSCSIHDVDPPPINRVTGLRLDLWPHGLKLSIEALVSVVAFLPPTDPMLLSGLTAAIICQYEDNAIRGALQPHQLVELHCAHLRISVQANRNWLQQGGDGRDLWDVNDPGAQGRSWLIGLMQLVNHPPPSGFDALPWQPLVPHLLRSFQLAMDLLPAVPLSEKALLETLWASLRLLHLLKAGTSGQLWRIKCALQTIVAATDPEGALRRCSGNQCAVDLLLCAAVHCMQTAAGERFCISPPMMHLPTHHAVSFISNHHVTPLLQLLSLPSLNHSRGTITTISRFASEPASCAIFRPPFNFPPYFPPSPPLCRGPRLRQHAEAAMGDAGHDRGGTAAARGARVCQWR